MLVVVEVSERRGAGEYIVTWRQALTTPAWMTTFTVSIGAEGAENDVAPGFAVAGLVSDTHKSYVQVCGWRSAKLIVSSFSGQTQGAWLAVI